MRENRKKQFIILFMMLGIFIIYVVQEILPFQFLVYKVSLGWILVFVNICFFIFLCYDFLRSDMRFHQKLVLLCSLILCLFSWGIYVFFTDDFCGYNHNSSVIESPDGSRRIVVTDIGEWDGHSFCVYKKEYGMATLLHTEHTEIFFHSVSYDCQWMENQVWVRVSGDDMEYASFSIPYS